MESLLIESSESCSRPLCFWEFVPNEWSIKTKPCFHCGNQPLNPTLHQLDRVSLPVNSKCSMYSKASNFPLATMNPCDPPHAVSPVYHLHRLKRTGMPELSGGWIPYSSPNSTRPLTTDCLASGQIKAGESAAVTDSSLVRGPLCARADASWWPP